MMVSSTPTAKPTDQHRFFLKREQRICLNRDFDKLKRMGVRYDQGAFFIKVRDRQDSQPSRLGVITSRKVGPAVVRNKLRRLAREVFRLNQHVLPDGLDLLFIARPHLKHLTFQEIESRFLWIIDQIKKRLTQKTMSLTLDQDTIPKEHNAPQEGTPYL